MSQSLGTVYPLFVLFDEKCAHAWNIGSNIYENVDLCVDFMRKCEHSGVERCYLSGDIC